ncbi:hypothetical protein Tco_0453229 [Tanacetum coccineum]
MSFHQALDLIFELNETMLTTGRLIDGSAYGRIDIVIKDLDLELKIDAMKSMLQKETLLDVVGTSGCHCEVLQSFSAERIEQGNELHVLSLFATSRSNSVGSQRHHIVPFEELIGVSIALVARFRVISKSMDRIFVSHGGQ